VINLELSAREEEVLAEAHRQALIYRKHAPGFDKTVDHAIPAEILFAVPEEANFPHIRKMVQADSEGLGNYDLIDALIALEESWGGKVVHMRGLNSDMWNYALSQRLIRAVGTPEQVSQWGDAKNIAWGMTEPAAGSDPASMLTAARWTGEKWIINGEKIFISFATAAQAVVIMARAFGQGLENVITPFVVARSNRGMILSGQMEKLGQKQWDTVSIALVDCEVPESARLKGNLVKALSMFNATRGVLAAQAIGLAKASLDILRDVLVQRGITVDYGAPLSSRPAVVDRLIKLEEAYEAAWLMMVHTRWRLGQTTGLEAQYASLSKFYASAAARKICRECIDLLGQDASGKSYFLEQAMRDSRLFDIYEGAGDVLRIFVARWILGLKKGELN